MKTTTVTSKHQKKIVALTFNTQNKLALVSQDRTLSVNTLSGEVLEQMKLKYDPFDVQFAEQKVEGNGGAKSDSNNMGNDQTISINMGQSTILLYNLQDTSNPIELAFQQKYGTICSYHWFGDGYVLIGFSGGYVIAISTHMREIGEELQSIQIYNGTLQDVCYNANANLVAAVGEDGLKLVDTSESNWVEQTQDAIKFTKEEGQCEHMEFTKDGSILTVSTNGGYVFSYLIQSSSLVASDQMLYVARMSSLRHVTVTNINLQQGLEIEVSVEPQLMAVGMDHIGIGLNNHVWYYRSNHRTDTTDHTTQSIPPHLNRANTNITNHSSSVPIAEQEYLGTVKQLKLNQHIAAVLTENGRLHVHWIERTVDSESSDIVLPSDNIDERIVAMDCTMQYLTYATNQNTIYQFYIQYNLSQQSFTLLNINEYKHATALHSLNLTPLGTRLIFMDDTHTSYYYNVVDNTKLEIPSLSKTISSVLYDSADLSSSVFVTVDTVDKQLTTYGYTAQSIKGPSVQRLGSTKLLYNFIPTLLRDGDVYGLRTTGGGVVSHVKLTTHDMLTSSTIHNDYAQHRSAPDKLRNAFQQALQLQRLNHGYELALALDNRECYLTLAKRALELLNVSLAMRIYQHLQDLTMAVTLQPLQAIEERQLVAAQICVVQGDYTRAQSLFLSSTQPLCALQMRRDLKHYDAALKLATTPSTQRTVIPSASSMPCSWRSAASTS